MTELAHRKYMAMWNISNGPGLTRNPNLAGGQGMNDHDRILELEGRIKELETLMKNEMLAFRLAEVESRIDDMLGPPCFVDPLKTAL